ncbi:nucleotidyl transferase AbiEii/AbiGii toxin family protein [Candidatus Dojkabacteria bacterium]|uniref:Nucleotidyl transferase AbiEii/AbiGii toxin family protein n=1 Tax=Candidatus Dojkabacteria bacterium TaxID=2099670 RepID=A0A955L339_9BACT|nr:nucleotidyl transferase AbiEii/AbiGii toxin family protein [Candidatus Dojkabacteria bacterium]
MIDKIHDEVLTLERYELLCSLFKSKELNNFYLAGGTALALLIGHRKSEDIDLFTNIEFKSNLIQDIKSPYTVLSLHDNSIEIILSKTKVMFFYFGFESYKSTLHVKGLRLADPIDIGLMKLLALQGRSTRKDIVDLYFIHKQIIPLDKLFDIFEIQYPKLSFNSYESLKSLVNRNDLAKEPMPVMLEKVSWNLCLHTVEEEIKKHFMKLLKDS